MRIEYIIVSLVIALVVLLAVLLFGGNIIPAFKEGLKNLAASVGVNSGS